MRYLVGFLCVCTLGVMPLVGCDDFLQPQSCDGVVCEDDGNECTSESCICDGLFCIPECVSSPVANGTDCTFNSIAGVCVSGVCGENLCEGVVCDDDDVCTDDTCDYVDATCDFTPTSCDDGNGCTEDRCDPPDGCNFPPVEDGALCLVDPSFSSEGTCEAGTCVAPCDPASEEILQCPRQFLEHLFCCPGSEYCLEDCANGSRLDVNAFEMQP